MKKIYVRALSLLIVLCLLLPCSGISTLAVQYNGAYPPNASETFVDVANDASTDEVNEFPLPSFIDEDSDQAQKHLFRLEDLEEANTYVFQNNDGTRTVYVMDENVKYVDVDGNVREKDLSLIDVIGGYKTAANDIGAFMPDLPTSGIELEYSDHTVKLIPQTTAPTVGSKVGDAVTYDGAFGENTILRYTPLLSGIKEDIILESYVSNAEFSFELVTDGLRLQNSEGRYFLSSPQNGEIIFWLDDIIVYDAVGRPESGRMSVETLAENERYLLTVSVDDDYLSDPATIYPVTIDPTITVSDNTVGNSIEDSPIYEGYPSRNFGTYLYNPVGKFSDEYGVGRTVVRLTGLIGLEEYQSLTAAQIESVYFYITDASGSGSHTIDLYALTNTEWTESGVTWNNYGGYLPTKYASAALGSGSETCFDITDLVKAWKSGSRSAEAGFLLKNSTETLKRVYCSSEYSTASKKPRVVLTYVEEGSGGGSALDSAAVLSLNSPVSVSVVVANEMRYFKFTPSSTGFYSFESLNISSGDPYGWMYNNVNVLLSSDNNAGGNKNFRITYHLVSGATYFFAAGCFGTGTGGYTVRIKTETSASAVAASVLAWGTDKNITCTNKREVTVCTFTPSASGEYLFSSVSTSGTPKIWLYDASLTALGTNDCGSGHNFRLVKTLTSGSTYYVVFGQFAGRVGSYTVKLLRSASLSPAVYYLKNVGTSKYMDIDGPAAQEYVHQWTAHTGSQEKWSIQKQTDGYYTIRSEYGNKYYVGISSTSTEENNIKLYSGVTDSTKWAIYAISSGGYILEPKTALGKALYVPNSLTDTELQLSNLSASVSERNKWDLVKNALSYVNYYDSSFGSNSLLLSYVPKANEFSDFVFTKYFGIGMYMDGSASSYNTVLDDCSTGLNNKCTTAACGSVCNYGHHKNIFAISSQLYNDDREDNHLYVLWTDREYGKAYCCEQNGRHTSYSAIALVCNKWPVIHFLNIYGSNNSRQLACMSMNLVHETAHTMGMSDVYDNTGHDVSGTKCLMERFDETTAYAFYLDVLNGIEAPFCSSCMQSMRSYTNNVYYSGN